MRLDVFLAEKGYFPSRSKAQSAVKAGQVLIDGKVADKHSLPMEGTEKIEILQRDRYVSRAGEKLQHALESFSVDPAGLTVLDIGASTGGFTDCLLQHGAEFVYALDVGTAQLAEKLRCDNRVAVMESFNARNAVRQDFDRAIDMIVMDVSFISQSLIYPACGDILQDGGLMITLVKPQFEAGRSNIGKGGIVKDKDGKIIGEIMEKLNAEARKQGFVPLNFTQSPIEGGDGNREYLSLYKKQKA